MKSNRKFRKVIQRVGMGWRFRVLGQFDEQIEVGVRRTWREASNAARAVERGVLAAIKPEVKQAAERYKMPLGWVRRAA